MATELKMLQVFKETHEAISDLAHASRKSIRKYMEELAAEKTAELKAEQNAKAKASK